MINSRVSLFIKDGDVKKMFVQTFVKEKRHFEKFSRYKRTAFKVEYFFLVKIRAQGYLIKKIIIKKGLN